MANIIERGIEIISPLWAAERAAARAQLDVWRSYDAGGMGPRTKNVDRTNRSAPAETIFSFSRLRGFSRELERNEPNIKNAIEVLTNNIIGSGILPTPSGESRGNKQAVNVWTQWAETTECDQEGLHNFNGLLDIIDAALHRDGEVLIVRRRTSDKNAYLPIRIQVLEADFLDHNKTMPVGNGSDNIIVQGVEYNKAGRRVAYWIYQEHPGETLRLISSVSTRVPADDVAHIFKQDRPGQVRGIPTGVQAFVLSQDLKDYVDAQLLRQKLAACYVGFVTTQSPMGVAAGSWSERSAERMQPGTITYMPPGDSMQFGSPPPAEGYADYMRTNERRIASAYGITYEALTNDYSNVNFSSGRMGWLNMARNVSRWQSKIIIPMACGRVWGWMVEAAVMTGQLSTSVGASWTPPRREMIDPLKEFEAIKIQLRLNLISWQDAARELGWSVEMLKREIVEDQEWFDREKLFPEGNPKYDPKRDDNVKVVN